MHLIAFFEHIAKGMWQPKSVVCFLGKKNYPGLFFMQLWQQLHFLGIDVTSIASQEKNIQLTQLQQSFLGEQKLYWLGDVWGDEKQKSHSVQHMLGYMGPHMLYFFAREESLAQENLEALTIIELDELCNFGIFEHLVRFFGVSFNQVQIQHAKKFFLKINALPLDNAILLMNYLDLMPQGTYEDLEQLNIFSYQTRLFDLSLLFFKKDAKNFFQNLQNIQEDYEEIFWITYWSDQIWRAYHVIDFLHQKQINEAKRMSARLPFAFLTQFWRLSSCEELRNAYAFLYNADYMLKTGSTFPFLDLFYLQFFNGTFATQKLHD